MNTATDKQPVAGLRACGLLAILTAGVFLAGCDDPAIAKGWARREQTIHQTLNMLREREAEGDERLSAALAEARHRLASDARRTRENRRLLREALDAEFQRWAEHEPLYHQAVRRELAGDAEGVAESVREVLK